MYLPTPDALLDADACFPQRSLWAALFFDDDLGSTKQIEWTAEHLQTCRKNDVNLVWGFDHGLGGTLPRKLALLHPEYAYLYARYVDQGPHDDTRNAVLGSAHYAYLYAEDVDQGPHDDTRNAVLGSAHYAGAYAKFVDKGLEQS